MKFMNDVPCPKLCSLLDNMCYVAAIGSIVQPQQIWRTKKKKISKHIFPHNISSLIVLHNQINWYIIVFNVDELLI
jgi:hypothetical protein